MLYFLLKRVFMVIPTFIGITLLVFLLVHSIPGDPVEIMAGMHKLSPEDHARMLHAFGLDKSLFMQYVSYLGKVLTGDLGVSFESHETVLSEFMARFPATVELSLCAMVVAVVIGIPAGVLAGIYRGKAGDYGIMTVALTGYSMPLFWWAMLLIMFFSGFLGILPVSGRISPIFDTEFHTGFMLIDTLFFPSDEGAFKSALSHIVLPTIALSTIPMAVIARMTRSSILEVLNDEYIKVARAKGASSFRIIFIHALRNALMPVITVIGLQVGVLFAGAVLTESTFSWPGIGKWIVASLGSRDYPVIQGGVLIIALCIVIVNLLVDIIYGIINPRIRKS